MPAYDKGSTLSMHSGRMPMVAEVVLIVPQLLASPVPARPPALERLLARARRKAGAARDFYTAVCEFAFGTRSPHWPAGPVCRGGDGGACAPGWWRADPVTLLAGPDGLRLYACPVEAAEQRTGLARSLAEHFAVDELQLETPTADRWYVHLPAALTADSVPSEQAAGRNIDVLLPRGPDARRLIALMNEIQMLFHGDPVNEQRRAAGLPAVDGLWIWGGGTLPALREGLPDACSSHPYVIGLWAVNGGRCAAPPAAPADWLAAHAGRRILVTCETFERALRDVDVRRARRQALDDFEATWGASLMQAMRCGYFEQLRLLPLDASSFELSRSAHRRWWRRRRPFADWCG